jgi:hypothetical protein
MLSAMAKTPPWLRRGTGTERREVQGQALLTDGDSFYIQGGLSASSDPLDWQFLFHDPEGTQATHSTPYPAHLEYDGGRLFKVEGETRHHIALRSQEDKLIRYMLRRNQQNHDVPVLIPVSSLMRSVWDEDQERAEHEPQELHRLIFTLRHKLEANPQAPLFLVNERGLGYLLDTRPSLW